MKFIEKSRRNVFKKNVVRDINNKYNLLNKNKDFYEIEELYTRKTENIVLDDITKELNYMEGIIVKIFSKIFIKVYKIGIMYGFNNK